METERMNLSDLITKNNILTRPLGVNYKEVKSSLLNLRLNILFMCCYADLIHNFVMSTLPYQTMRTEKMLYGDISVVVFDQNYGQILIAQYCYRLSSVLMLTIFRFDNRSWIEEASRYYDKIQTPELSSKLLKLRRKCYNYAFYNCVGRQMIISTAVLAITPGRIREFGYDILLVYGIFVGFIIFTPLMNSQFLMDLNLLCWTSVHCFKNINGRMLSRYSKNSKRIHPKYIEQFSDTCCLVQELMKYCKKIFIVFYSVNLVLIVFVMYALFFTKTMPILMRILIGAFVTIECFEVLYFSYAIGKIDSQAKSVTNVVYRHFLLKQNHFDDKEMWKYSRFFHIVWATNIGITVLGQPISPETSIKVITIAMTAMTIIMQNFSR